MSTDKSKIPVALDSCRSYGSEVLADAIDRLLSAVNFHISRGSLVLLKPNLVSSSTADHFGCTSPEFTAAVCRWFLDRGVKVRVGDSPAFGTAGMVMRATGMAAALAPLGVVTVNFSKSRKITLPCGFTVPVAEEALNCDALINLPKIKAHNQLYISLAVKNFFGVVCGWKKALHHALHGDVDNLFESLLVDLPLLFPESYTIVDGITALHKEGPIKGDPFPLGVVGAAKDPVALDTALMQIIGADPARSIIAQECIRRKLPGSDPENIDYPLQRPDDLAVEGFVTPGVLQPVTFHPVKMAVSGCRRIVARISGE